MAGKRSEEHQKQLDSDVKKILGLAKRASGVRSGELQETLGCEVKTHRYRVAMKEAKKQGLKVDGEGPLTVYRTKK